MPNQSSKPNGKLDRRSLIGAAGGALAATMLARRSRAMDSRATDSRATDAAAIGDSTLPTSADLEPLTAADFERIGTCTLLPEMTAGPFPLDEQFDRRDVTEGYPGHPLRLGLRVVAGDCAAVGGATVEIWHTDATGDYSAFADGGGGKDEADGTTFLRGSQTAGDDGIVEFQTIYPGWYPGRAVHIHVRVHIDDEAVVTSQLFFDDTYTTAVYSDGPYAEFGEPDTSLGDDGIAGNIDISGAVLQLSAADTVNGRGTLGLLNVGL